MPDSYNCHKKMNYYVLNYGPSYASEIYHYLSTSQLLESLAYQKKINILSLGCGFAPDLIAISKYISDKQLSLQYHYHGVEQSNCWESARYSTVHATFEEANVTQSINLTDYDLIFIVKLFSTLYKNNVSKIFLETFKNAVQNQLKNESIIVFDDINSRNMGRDIFHNSIQSLFRNSRQFYFDQKEDWTPNHWIQISQKNVIFNIPNGLRVSPLRKTTKTVIFEYRK